MAFFREVPGEIRYKSASLTMRQPGPAELHTLGKAYHIRFAGSFADCISSN